MPKGRHKGGKRCFTNFDELKQQQIKEQKEKEWRKARGEEDSDKDSDEENDESSTESGSGSEEESGDEAKPKPKGIEGLIEIENPNHVVQKMKKLSTLSSSAGIDGPPAKPQLTRKEREELERQRGTANYRRLHAQGKTDEAKADLERLAMIRKQREEAQKKKEEEKKAKEMAATARREKVAKALNKKER